MNRRELIKAFAGAAPLTVAGRVWAAPATDARLLVVFLRGAYDAANVVVPIGSDFYRTARPKLGLVKPDAGNPNAALSLNADWGCIRRCATASIRCGPNARSLSCRSPVRRMISRAAISKRRTRSSLVRPPAVRAIIVQAS